MTDDNALNITRTEGGYRIENAPLPEYITVTPELWAEIKSWEGSASALGRLEEIPHAGSEVRDADGQIVTPARENDGYVLHLDAENVTCSYRFPAEPQEEVGDATGTLVSWGEK